MSADQIFTNYFAALERIVNYNRNILKEKLRLFKINVKLNSTNVRMRNALIDWTYNHALTLLRKLRNRIRIIQVTPIPSNDEKIIEILEKVQPATVSISKHGIKTARLQNEITEQYIHDVFGILPNHKFSWYVLDKDNNIQRVTPNSPTYTPANVKKHYFGVLAQFYDVKHKYLQVYPANSEPQDFKLFNGNINCVLDTISRQIPKLAKSIKKYAEDNNFINNNRPATKADLDAFHKKFRVRIIVHSQTGIWYTSNLSDKSARKEIHIYAHDEHASTFIPITPIDQVVIHSTQQDMLKQLKQLHQPIKQNIKFSMQDGQEYREIKSFRAGKTIHKTYRPPDDSKDFYHCDSDLSFNYTKWQLENNIRPLEEPYYSIMKSSNHHLTTQQFQSYNNNTFYHSYDMNKAFPSYKSSKYYPKYQLFVGFVNLYKNTDKSYITDYPGVSKIENVVYKNSIIEKTQWIQSDNYYTHIRLNFIIENDLATFDVTETVIAKSEDLRFPFKPFDNNPDNKRFNNAFIGRLIAGGHDNLVTNYYSTSSEQELQQLKYELEQKPETLTVIPEDNLLVHTYKSLTNNALFHIQSQIIDYQQVTLMEQMCQVPEEELIAFFTDGFFTTTEQLIQTSDKPHEFKYAYEKIKGTSTPNPTKHTILFDFPINPPDITKHISRLNGFSATIGPAGCGKTYISIEKHPRVNRIILGPNHKIVADHSTFGTSQTYHKFFGIGVAWHKQKIYEQIDLDEITEVSDEHMQLIISTCTKYRMNLTVFGDFGMSMDQYVKIYQRPPPRPSGVPIKVKTLRDFKITEEISNIRRQSFQDAFYLDLLRDLTPQQQLDSLRQHPNVKTIQSTDVPYNQMCGIAARHTRCSYFNKYCRDQQQKEYITQKTNIFECFHPTRIMKSVKSLGEIKGKLTKKNINEIWFDRESSTDEIKRPSHLRYEAAYFRTADNIQGESISDPIYIDTTHLDPGFLYTAISRCRSLDQLHLII